MRHSIRKEGILVISWETTETKYVSTIVVRKPDLGQYYDTVNPIALLAGYIQYTSLPDLETYISTALIKGDKLYIYDRVINDLNSEE